MSKIESPGRYAATVQKAEFGESPNGTPYLQLDFVTEDGALISGWLYLSEKALPGTMKTLRGAFEFDGNFETVLEQVTDKPCSLTIEVEEYQGTERLKVKWINSPRSSKPIDNQGEFLKALSAKAARIPKEAPRAAPAPTTTASRPLPATAARKPVVAAKPAPVGAKKEDGVPF